jgi:hypothetical protein
MRFAPIALLALFAAPVAAQSHGAHAATEWTAAHDSVLAPIKRLFDGMRAHDSAMVRSAFAPGAMMMGPFPRNGLPSQVAFSSVDGFVAAAGQPGAPWDEQIYDPRIEIDGNLATAWVFYTFHLGPNFTHCGVDALQLIRTASGWKISVIADTRRTTGCETEGKRKV